MIGAQSVIVTLEPFEIRLAMIVGGERQLAALALPDRHGFEGVGWNVHIEGAAGEIAYAKMRDKFWNGSVNTFKSGGDVGAVQVRTRSLAHYDLLVRDDDRDEDVFVLVTGTIPTFNVRGWCYGSAAKQERYRQTYGGREPAFFVPQSDLRIFA